MNMKAISSLKFPLLEVRVEAGGGGGLQLNWAGDVLVPEEKRKQGPAWRKRNHQAWQIIDRRKIGLNACIHKSHFGGCSVFSHSSLLRVEGILSVTNSIRECAIAAVAANQPLTRHIGRGQIIIFQCLQSHLEPPAWYQLPVAPISAERNLEVPLAYRGYHCVIFVES